MTTDGPQSMTAWCGAPFPMTYRQRPSGSPGCVSRAGVGFDLEKPMGDSGALWALRMEVKRDRMFMAGEGTARAAPAPLF